MVTLVTLIMWTFLSDGSSTYTTKQITPTEDASALINCLTTAHSYLQSEHEMEPEGSTFAAGCVVHQQRVS
jgi:hypothetical protein